MESETMKEKHRKRKRQREREKEREGVGKFSSATSVKVMLHLLEAKGKLFWSTWDRSQRTSAIVSIRLGLAHWMQSFSATSMPTTLGESLRLAACPLGNLWSLAIETIGLLWSWLAR